MAFAAAEKKVSIERCAFSRVTRSLSNAAYSSLVSKSNFSYSLLEVTYLHTLVPLVSTSEKVVEMNVLEK